MLAVQSNPLKEKEVYFIRPNFLKRQLSLRKRVKNFTIIHCERTIVANDGPWGVLCEALCKDPVCLRPKPFKTAYPGISPTLLFLVHNKAE